MPVAAVQRLQASVHIARGLTDLYGQPTTDLLCSKSRSAVSPSETQPHNIKDTAIVKS